MKTKLLFCFYLAICMFPLLDGKGQPLQSEFANYITISNGEFRDGNNVFKPLCVNYIEDFACNLHDSSHWEYYIAPHFNYSRLYRTHNETEFNDSIYGPHWGYGDNGLSEMDTAKAKLNADLVKIHNLGFNVIRLRSGVFWKNDSLHIPTGSYAGYFELMDDLLVKCAQCSLRVILVLNDDTNTYCRFDEFCVCIDSITRHFSNNKTVMAYVVLAEPGYKWTTNPDRNNDKLMISNWSRKWYYLIKKNAPNQLVTYGLDGIGNVLFWDPSALTYDFLSMHFYHNASSPNLSLNAVHSYFKWMNDNVQDVWMLGETGFSGTDSLCNQVVGSQTGVERDQYDYASSTMQTSLECGCKGYAWWQYQEVNWQNCREDHYGLVTHFPDERLKAAHSLFPEFKNRTAVHSCVRPNSYYNIWDYPYPNISGVVKDEYSNPVKDALVVAWSDTYQSGYSTFTNSQGKYTIYTNPDTVLFEMRVSHIGYDDKRFFIGNSMPPTTTLTHINYNG